MKRALVTGGAGFIGSFLCEKLLTLGYSVFCVDDLYSGNQNNIKHLKENDNFVFFISDVTTLFELEVDEIYNLASPASPKDYQANPMYTIKTGVDGAIRMASLAQKLKCKLFQASTSEVYGDPQIHPQPESYWRNVNPIGVRACYDESKRLAESILFIYYREQHFPLKVGRIFNTYGPRMACDDGRVITNFINQAICNKDITVYGNGLQTRSFCYISDLVDGMIKFMGSSDEITGPMNLGSQFEYSILEVAETIIKLTGSNSKIIFQELPEDDPVKRRPDITLAKNLLQWEPKVSLEEGLIKTIAYYTEIYRS
ncbi:MAG TPA: UDP-glucuronic acid decarboxylase family protein [Chlamydiales bacterium]|nr:MAG: NAD-dependent dehydratase [Verrucomicrobia bacterium RIFCSPHIGHO2_12_FULL_41_10]HLB52563.1 UDP-glucuronic acid decarboxylase family protein [Chlamydiales bacterium]